MSQHPYLQSEATLHLVHVVLHHVGDLRAPPLGLDVLLDRLADRVLARALADLGDVRAAEAVSELDQQVEVDVGRDGGLAQIGLEDLVGVWVVWLGGGGVGWWCGVVVWGLGV